MNELQIFKNSEFGEVRTIEENGNILFCGSDVAKALGYTNAPDALSRHCRSIVKRDTATSQGNISKMSFVPEGDLYRLVVNSKLPSAEKFERWVFDEVLPSIRKHGAYIAPNLKQSAAEARLLNARARVSNQWMKLAQQVSVPEYKQICASYASNVLAGNPVIPLPSSEQKFLSATEIGDMFGVSANSIGKLANKNQLKNEQYGKWFHDKSRYSAKEVDVFKYNDEAVRKFKELLINN